MPKSYLCAALGLAALFEHAHAAEGWTRLRTIREKLAALKQARTARLKHVSHVTLNRRQQQPRGGWIAQQDSVEAWTLGGGSPSPCAARDLFTREGLPEDDPG